MTKKRRPWIPIILLIFIIWGALSWKWYTCWIKGFCDRDNTVTAPVAEAPDVAQIAPIAFNWESAKALITGPLDQMRSQITSHIEGNKQAIITGFYTQGEMNTTAFDNLGIARATAVRDALGFGEGAGITLESKMVNKGNIFDNLINFRSAYSIDLNNQVEETLVRDLGDKALIFFPFNSDDSLTNTEVAEYINNLAARAQDDPSLMITIVGHTDNIGDAGYNEQLGGERARDVKSMLVEKGIAGTRITTESRGETAPVATNDTEEGRQLNRRAEIIVR